MNEKIPTFKSVEIKEESESYKLVRDQQGRIFDKFSDPKERMDAMQNGLEAIFRNFDKELLSEEKADEIKNEIQSCENILEKQQFLDAIMKALSPVLDIKESHPAKFEEAQARALNESEGIVEINRLLSYGKTGSEIHFHAPAGKTVDNKITLYREGMRKLAEIVEKDTEVEKITATSYLVAEHPGLFAIGGFEVGEVPVEMRKEHFVEEGEEIKRAEISREKFLKKFLKKDK